VPTSTIDPHRDPSKSPTISSINAGNNVASVVFVSTGSNNEINPQTDAGSPTADHCGRWQYRGRRWTLQRSLLRLSYRYKRPDGTTASLQPHVQLDDGIRTSSASPRLVTFTSYTIQLLSSNRAGGDC
jgi:hypothetical protein